MSVLNGHIEHNMSNQPKLQQPPQQQQENKQEKHHYIPKCHRRTSSASHSLGMINNHDNNNNNNNGKSSATAAANKIDREQFAQALFPALFNINNNKTDTTRVTRGVPSKDHPESDQFMDGLDFDHNILLAEGHDIQSKLTGKTNSSKNPIPFSFTKLLKHWDNVHSLVMADILFHHVEMFNHHTLEYQPNYASLAALSLYQAGADDDTIRDRVTKESLLLDPLPPLISPTDMTAPFKTTLSKENWKSYLGKGPDCYTDLLIFFFNEISTEGIHETIKTYIPILFDGLSSFHPLISLGAGLVSRIHLLVAQALAYWTYSYHKSVDKINPPTDDKWEHATILEILQDMQEDKDIQAITSNPSWGSMEWHKRMRKIVKGNKNSNVSVANKLSEFVSTWNKPFEDFEEACKEFSKVTTLCTATTGNAFPRNMDYPLTMGLIAFDSLGWLLNVFDEGDEQDEKMKIDLIQQFLFIYLACYLSQGCPQVHEELLGLAYPSRRTSLIEERLDDQDDKENLAQKDIDNDDNDKFLERGGGTGKRRASKLQYSSSPPTSAETPHYHRHPANKIKPKFNGEDSNVDEFENVDDDYDRVLRPDTPPIHERVLRDFSVSAKSLLSRALHRMASHTSSVGSGSNNENENLMDSIEPTKTPTPSRAFTEEESENTTTQSEFSRPNQHEMSDVTMDEDSGHEYENEFHSFFPTNNHQLGAEWDRLCGAPYGDICLLQSCHALRKIHTDESLKAAYLLRSFVTNNNWEFRGTGNGYKDYYMVDGGISDGYY